MHWIIKHIAYFLKRLPDHFRNRLFEIVLYRFPLCFIKRIPCSYSTYLACYTPQKGDVVLDCGAHIGNCAILFSRLVGKKGLVVAVEPFEEPCHILLNRIRRLRLGNVIVVEKGVWNKPTRQSLWVSTSSFSGRMITKEKSGKNSAPGIAINFVMIDDLVGELKLNRLDLIKMDIEGAEIEALEGAEVTIQRLFPHFAIASYHLHGNKKSCYKVEKFLEGYGYQTRTFFPAHLTTCGKNIDRQP